MKLKYLPEFLPSLMTALQESGAEYRLWAFDNMPSDRSNDDFFIEMQLMLTRSELLDFICKTTEFGSQIFPSNGESSREIKEHGTVIIKDTAISDLNQI